VADVRDVVWQFVRGALPVSDFETWCYQARDLEDCLGKDFYVEVVATPFDDPSRVAVLKKSLHGWLGEKGYPTCDCFLWGSLKKMGFGREWTENEIDARLELVRKRTPWLDLRKCCRCGQAWYVACDTVDDDWYFKRMSEEDVVRALEDVWPKDFDGESKYGLD
jgi:hypothetical protein